MFKYLNYCPLHSFLPGKKFFSLFSLTNLSQQLESGSELQAKHNPRALPVPVPHGWQGVLLIETEKCRLFGTFLSFLPLCPLRGIGHVGCGLCVTAGTMLQPTGFNLYQVPCLRLRTIKNRSTGEACM